MTTPLTMLPMARPVPPGAGLFQLPSADQAFVIGTIKTRVGMVPKVGSQLSWQDRRGHYLVRWNIGRDRFTVDPGLYGLGQPDCDSDILVTANYKLTFDLLRQTMADHSCWILVLDTKGINVWCAAGKGTFGTEELVDRIQASRLDEVVNHRKLIVPQLGATGVAAHEVKKHSGFSVFYGPVMLYDLPRFIANNGRTTPEMRRKRFPFKERLVLVPVELMQGLKQMLPAIAIFMVAAGFAKTSSFPENVIIHGLPPAIAILCGIAAGNIITPLLLPWIPGRAFSIKGAVCGMFLFFLLYLTTLLSNTNYSMLEKCSWFLISIPIASWLGMAFTGASTYTSLNGVRKEMLLAMPAQFIIIVGGTLMWAASLWA